MRTFDGFYNGVKAGFPSSNPMTFSILKALSRKMTSGKYLLRALIMSGYRLIIPFLKTSTETEKKQDMTIWTDVWAGA